MKTGCTRPLIVKMLEKDMNTRLTTLKAILEKQALRKEAGKTGLLL